MVFDVFKTSALAFTSAAAGAGFENVRVHVTQHMLLKFHRPLGELIDVDPAYISRDNKDIIKTFPLCVECTLKMLTRYEFGLFIHAQNLGFFNFLSASDEFIFRLGGLIIYVDKRYIELIPNPTEMMLIDCYSDFFDLKLPREVYLKFSKRWRALLLPLPQELVLKTFEYM